MVNNSGELRPGKLSPEKEKPGKLRPEKLLKEAICEAASGFRILCDKIAWVPYPQLEPF